MAMIIVRIVLSVMTTTGTDTLKTMDINTDIGMDTLTLTPTVQNVVMCRVQGSIGSRCWCTGISAVL
jgi:hypothetical protein